MELGTNFSCCYMRNSLFDVQPEDYPTTGFPIDSKIVLFGSLVFSEASRNSRPTQTYNVAFSLVISDYPFL